MAISQKSKIKIYIAGPFFNEPQLRLIKAIEDDLTAKEVDFYSPRLHPGNEPGKPIDNKTAAAIFKSNVDAIAECTHVLAVMCWLLPERNELRVMFRKNPSTVPADWEALSPQLSLPDTGTVFEMGLAWGMALSEEHGPRPIIGYTNTKPGEGKLNIMLTQACRGVICGSDNMDRAFKNGEIVWDEIKPWTGKNL
jgi:nucleoside 2-deoxyribosyltransferase